MCALANGCGNKMMVPTILPEKEELEMIICEESAVSWASTRDFMYYLGVLRHNSLVNAQHTISVLR